MKWEVHREATVRDTPISICVRVFETTKFLFTDILRARVSNSCSNVIWLWRKLVSMQLGTEPYVFSSILPSNKLFRTMTMTYNLHEDLHGCNTQFTWRSTRPWRTIYMNTYTTVTYNLHEDLHNSDVQFTWRSTRLWRTIYMKIYTSVTYNLHEDLHDSDVLSTWRPTRFSALILSVTC